MSKFNYISKGLRKVLAFPFKLVGNTFIALAWYQWNTVSRRSQ